MGFAITKNRNLGSRSSTTTTVNETNPFAPSTTDFSSETGTTLEVDTDSSTSLSPSTTFSSTTTSTTSNNADISPSTSFSSTSTTSTNVTSNSTNITSTLYDGTQISTGYSILYDISEDFELQFYTDTTEVLEEIINAYKDGSGNNFQFDDDLNQDVSSIPNDLLVGRQRNETTDGTIIEITDLYQFLFNYQSQSRQELLDYNFNLTEEQIVEILESSLDLIAESDTSETQFQYDFKFIEEGTISDSDVITIL